MMYESVIVDLYGYLTFDQSDTVLDPESSEDSVESEEDSTDISEEIENGDIQEEPGSMDRTSGEDNGSSDQSSGNSMSADHTGDNVSDNDDRQDSETEEEGSDAGSDLEFGTESGDPEDGTYEIIIRGDSDQVGDLYRYLNGDENNGDAAESDNDEDIEYVEYDSGEYPSESGGSGDSESGTESGTSVPENDNNADEFYSKNIEFLGVIAGCLFFLVFVTLMKYIYKFFRIFF